MSTASSLVCSPLATASSACLLPPSKHCAAPSLGKLQGRRLSCRATARSGTVGDENVVRRNVDRRDVLLGLTGFAAAATTTTNLGQAIAADDGGAAAEPLCATVPITAEVLKCSAVDGFHCPAEYDSRKVVDFRSLPRPRGPPRVRRPAHMMEDEYVKKFEEAIRRMKELGDEDPRSYKNQAGIHEAYCDGHYKVVSASSPEVKFDVHFSSIFAPWHRMYIYFFERILGDLIGDPTFGLPYWNWDAPEGMIMPSIFANEFSPLYHVNRNPEHARAFMDLNLGPAKQPNLPQPECNNDNLGCLIENNLYSMYRQMTVDTPEEFHGGKFCTAGKKYTGSLENGAHTAAHIWVGNDMGNLKTAARDPVFYSNHSNVDRMWHLWSTKLGRSDLPYQEWLDTSFVFYNETKQPVRIRVQDVLDTGKLGYTYEEKKKLEWMKKRPKPSTGIRRIAKRSVTPAATSFPISLKNGQKEYVTVERPEKAQRGGGSSKEAPEVLVLDLTVDPCEYAKFDVLVNVPRGQEEKVGPKNTEYAGSFTHVPHGGGDGGRMMETQEVSYRLKLREIIEDLKCGRDKRLDITLVPVAGKKTFVNNVRIDIL
ncbi:unnamed protein product [Alopecurus aequalis]